MENSIIAFLSSRRSAKPDRLVEPGPTPAEIETILTIASRVPDHKKLVPWRFILIEGEGRAKLGEVIAQTCIEAEREPPSHVRLETERNRLMRAPLVVAAVSRVVPHRSAPEMEQVLSCGAACFNLCLAANALGYGTAWLSEWIAYNARIGEALKLAENERIAGFIYIGTLVERSPERERPDLADIITRWDA